MSDEPNDFSALLDRVVQGDERAIQELCEQYQEPLIKFIRRRLRLYPQLRRLDDSIDLLQEVWQKVFAHPEKLRDVSTLNNLMQYLVKTANHRVEHARRKHLDAQKHDLRRDASLSDPNIEFAAMMRADPHSDPSAKATFYDLWFRWLRSLSKPQRVVALMLRSGFTYLEIAERMNCSVRTIERMVAEIRDKLPAEMSR